MPNLEWLWLQGNFLTGTIPADLVSVSSSIFDFRFFDNVLTGTIPEFANVAIITHAMFQLNGLTGAMPASFCSSAPIIKKLIADCTVECSCCTEPCLTEEPSSSPVPTISIVPSESPSIQLSGIPSVLPSVVPSDIPSHLPSHPPSADSPDDPKS